jgi:hypothetical protein
MIRATIRIPHSANLMSATLLFPRVHRLVSGRKFFLRDITPIGVIAASMLGAQAQDATLDFSAFSSGGGISSAGPYAIAASIGEIAGQLTGGDVVLTSGFIGALGGPGATPGNLSALFNNGSLVISWDLSTSLFTLLQTANLEAPSWSPVSATPVTVGSKSQVTITPGQSMRFYRLMAQ